MLTQGSLRRCAQTPEAAYEPVSTINEIRVYECSLQRPHISGSLLARGLERRQNTVRIDILRGRRWAGSRADGGRDDAGLLLGAALYRGRTGI